MAWSTSRRLTIAFAVLSLFAGVAPAGVAYIGALLVDGVVAAISSEEEIRAALTYHVFFLVAMEGALVAIIAGAQRGIWLCQSLLRAQISHRIHLMILEKSLSLELAQFEDSEFYDKLSRARREASIRPHSLVVRTFHLAQSIISLASFAGVLATFSPIAVALLAVAGLPVFLSETKFSEDAFRLFLSRSPDTRMQMYLETVLTRDDHAKEVKLLGIGPLLLQRYRNTFHRLYEQDFKLALRRDLWGFSLGMIGTCTAYCTYAWIAASAIATRITLGEMTMYLALFRQGQSAISGALSSASKMYEDSLYLSTLDAFLEHSVIATTRRTLPLTRRSAEHGIRFDSVSFKYPGASHMALLEIDLHVRPGESLALVGDNGSGKTTFVKLLTGLYKPTSGRITLDGQDLRDWDQDALHKRMSVIFQDFVRYQLTLGENIGVGNIQRLNNETHWCEAGNKGMVDEFVASLPNGYHTQLGRWFEGGRELSGGQWQKVALARVFMRMDADILVLDEPTAAMDANAERTLYERFGALTKDRISILISHRFSTVRMASKIAVLHQGQITEQGSHRELMSRQGRYARMFAVQAAGYR